MVLKKFCQTLVQKPNGIKTMLNLEKHRILDLMSRKPVGLYYPLYHAPGARCKRNFFIYYDRTLSFSTTIPK